MVVTYTSTGLFLGFREFHTLVDAWSIGVTLQHCNIIDIRIAHGASHDALRYLLLTYLHKIFYSLSLPFSPLFPRFRPPHPPILPPHPGTVRRMLHTETRVLRRSRPLRLPGGVYNTLPPFPHLYGKYLPRYGPYKPRYAKSPFLASKRTFSCTENSS